MSIPLPFLEGVTSLLKCSWTLELKTPLVIRASTKASIRNTEGKKGREKTNNFRWEEQSSQGTNWTAVRDFNYEFYVENEELKARYSIPGSSIRGALRQSLIHSLVANGEELLFSLPRQKEVSAGEKKNLMIRARTAVENEGNRWNTILSLFGIAYDLNPGVDKPLIWSGRLEMGSITIDFPENISSEEFRYEENAVNACAPKNIKKHIKTRNPLDRVTMGAKKSGLHSVIEMSEGQKFTVEFRILNPKPNDIRIISLWKRDINTGFIRFGGLTSQGRGKVSIVDVDEHYALFAAQHTALAKEIRALEKEDIAEEFTGIWNGAALDLEVLRKPEIMTALQH